LGARSSRPFDDLGDDSADALVSPGVLGCWSPSLARRIAKLLIAWDAAGDPRGEVLAAAAHAQAEQFGPVFAQAVLPALVEHCAPALVEALGATQTRSVIGPLLEAVPFDEARPAVQVALACAMGELGGSVARAHLADWGRRPGLPRSVRHEIQFALAHLG
jgi:hypothetical protein